MSAGIAVLRRPSDWHAERFAQLDSFHPAYRSNVAELSRLSPALADLAETFPGLLFALASGFGNVAQRNTTIQLIHDGAPLRSAAHALGLPLWLRRLPPQAFGGPLPRLDASEDFHERVANLLPTDPNDARNWLWVVGLGLNACHGDFAVWAASWINRQPRTMLASLGEANFRYMAAWAWYASQPHTMAQRIMRRPWTPQMGLRRSVDELTVWRYRSRMAMVVGSDIGDTWIADGHALGFDFVALRTAADFVAESDAMDNCLDQFADRLEEGRSRVFSIRRGGLPVADVEIGLQDSGTGMPAILQLRAAKNRRASPEIWQATYAWLGSQPLKLLVASRMRRDDLRLKLAGREFWLPYLEHLEPGLRREFRAILAGDLGVCLGPVQRRRHREPRRG